MSTDAEVAEREGFHLVEQCHPVVWTAAMASLRPIYERFLEENRRDLRHQVTPEPSIERA